MVGPPSSMDSGRWRSFFRTTLRSWKDYPQLRAMDRATFDRYESDAKFVQDAVAALASTPGLDAAFLSAIAPALERLLQRMYGLGDDITAFLLFKQVGSLLEDHGLDEPAAHALQWAGRCCRDLRFFDEAQIHFDRAMVCLQRVGKDHPYFVDLYGGMGILCHFTRRWDEAEAHYRKSLDLLKQLAPRGRGAQQPVPQVQVGRRSPQQPPGPPPGPRPQQSGRGPHEGDSWPRASSSPASGKSPETTSSPSSSPRPTRAKCSSSRGASRRPRPCSSST